MDMRSWKKVLLQWANECGFMERNYFNIEQSDIEVFYQNFCLHHPKTDNGKFKCLSDFLKEFYPNFESHADDENDISSADYIYIYSMLLHFCCVRYPETAFHEICQRLPEHAQQCIASFFKELLDIELLSKENLRHAIAHVVTTNKTPPRNVVNESFVGNQSANAISVSGAGSSGSNSSGSQNSPNFIRFDSPLKTPKRCAGPQRVSPATPKSNLLEQRTRELYNLKAQLETERYEKGILEVQIKQNEDKIYILNHDHKKLIQQIQDLKNDILYKTSEGISSTNRDSDDQIRKRLLKEVSQKESELSKQSDDVRTLREEKILVQEKLNYAEKKIVLCMNRIKEMDIKVEELTDQIEQKNDKIQYLTNSNKELEQFVSEMRSATSNNRNDLNSSIECFDSSFVRNIGNTNTSSNISSPENLGVSVVDVQLREKEHENSKLKEELELVKDEHKRLAKNLHDLAEKQAKEFDIVIEPPNLSDDTGESERGESSQVDPLEQFNIFSNCMEKISSYHKFEQQKVKELKTESLQLQEVNKDLINKLSLLTQDMATLKRNIVSVEKMNADLLSCKKEMQRSLDTCHSEIEQLKVQKQEIFIELQNTITNKDSLSDDLKNLRVQLELANKSNCDLSQQCNMLKDQSADLQKQFEELQQRSQRKANELELHIKSHTEKLSGQTQEIAAYMTAQQSMKNNYEKILIENEEFKKKSHEADTHLADMKLELSEKQSDIDKLAAEIADFAEKNKTLEENIEGAIQDYQQEKISHENTQLEYQQEIQTLREKINSIELENREALVTVQSKHQREIKNLEGVVTNLQNVVDETSDLVVIKSQEKEELKQLLYEVVTPKVNSLLQLFKVSFVKEDCAENMCTLEQEVKCLHQQNIEFISKLKSLEILQQESYKKIEKLSKDVDEKNIALTRSKENADELLKLQQENNDYEAKMEMVKEKQQHFIDKVKQDLNRKEQDLCDRMQQASVEYEASLERIRIQLKHEKEHHNSKERELLLVIAEHNDVKKQLNAMELEVEKLNNENSQLLQRNSKMKLLESQVAEYSRENEKLQKEIGTFKHQVHQNAMRLVEADKALTELTAITKDQELHREELQKISKYIVEEKEKALQTSIKVQADLERKLQEQANTISALSENLNELEEHKEKLMHDIEDYVGQIQQVQEEKTILLNSLEKSADQLKLSMEEKERQFVSLEQKYQDVKEQLNDVSLQNTKLQGDLVERGAELRLGQEDHEQERVECQEIIQQLKQQLADSSEQLESFDMALMEILATMQNNFNLARELDSEDDIKNVFNVQKEQEKDQKLNQLRQNLNCLLHFDCQLQSQLKELSQTVADKTSSVESSKKTIIDLQYKLKVQNIELSELREQVENEEVIVEKRVSQEIRRLEDDLVNLEKVNERLTNGVFDMQLAMGNMEQDLKNAKSKLDKLEEEKLILKEEVCTKSKLLEKQKQEDKKNLQSLKEKTQQMDKLNEKCKLLESQHKEKTTKLQTLEKDSQTLKEKFSKQQQKISQQQQQFESLLSEQKKFTENLKVLQITNDSLENEVAIKKKEILSSNNKTEDAMQSLKNSEQQLELTLKKLDESEALKLNSEAKCERMLSETQQLLRDIEFLKAQQQSAADESQRLTKEIESLKQDKHHLREEIRDTKSDLQRANDNVSQLIQQISSIRLEKEAVVEENTLLKKQLEETGKHHSSSETKLKSIVEKTQDFERKLLTAENDLKSVKANLEKSELNAEKLSTENRKLRDTQESSTKRIEKLALKLGDSQARSTKLERDNEKLAKTLEANATTVEALQKEKDLLQSEAKSLKERVSRAERSHEQLAAKVQNLEHLNSQLQGIKQKLEASEIDGKSKLNKLEKMRDAHEEKIRKLTNSLNNAENNSVKLNLEIGALNSQLQESKSLNNQDQLQDLKQQLEILKQECANYKEITAKLQQNLHTLKEEKSGLSDQLSKATLNLKIAKEQCSELSSEMERMQAELLIMREEKSQAELYEKTSSQKIKNLELRNDTMIHERECSVAALEARVASLENKLSEKCKEVDSLQQEIHSIQESSESNSALLMQHTTATVNHSEELNDLRSKLSLADEALVKEQQLISQLKLDNQILHTKYQESKQRALDATKMSEERIKENRLELEGKLEKMKNKMKTLYTEEITKMKTKQEREMAILKSEMEVVKTQNIKYEEHTRKLSNQIVRLNDNILEYQKENTILSTKLKHLLENHETEKFKRPSSIHVSTISSSTGPVAASNTGTNLAMEDEEGEIFNNTYLTEIKTGIVHDYMSREVCTEELKFRNSLLPPHLKSSYAAQFDHDIPEDELKDGRLSMDDSMSALLSTTAGGTRKKCTGVTHYKRPGPPTPSKNGRLSFGGVGAEPMREILKESFDSNSAVTSSKTPARFTFFASRFSMGNGKDEKTRKPKSNENSLRKQVIKGRNNAALKKMAKVSNPLQLSGVVCTSTPRKSTIHFDQRRLISQMLSSSPSPSPLAMEHKNFKMEKNMTPPDVSIIETPLTALPKRSELVKAPNRKQNAAKRLEAIAVGLKNKRRNSSIFGRRLSRRMGEICTPTSGETTSSAGFSNTTPKDRKLHRRQTLSSVTTTSGGLVDKTTVKQRRISKKTQKAKGARPSLNLRGNIFYKYRTPNNGVQVALNKRKSRKQRNDHFNQGRNLQTLKGKGEDTTDDDDEETMIRNLTYDIQNNNHTSTYNRNDKLLGNTIVLDKRTAEKKMEVELFTNGSEIFESQIDTEDWSPHFEDYDSQEYEHQDDTDDHDDEDKDIKIDTSIFDKNIEYPMKYTNIPIKKETCKQELVSSFDLEEFDRFISKSKKKGDNLDANNSCSNGSSEHFEKLLLETESKAPFDIKHIDFEHSQDNSSHLETFVSSSELQNQYDITTATPHLPSCSTTPGHLSRTIYGGTVIYNRRLPHINTTYVRKSSIYIKNINDTTAGGGGDDVVLITNQTITLVDLARMFRQMDSPTRLIVSLAALASCTTLLGLFLAFYSKR